MNAASISNPDIIENGEDSDSDTNSEGIPDYYQPIGSYNGDDNEGVDVSLPNGHHHPALASACVEDSSEDDDDEQEDEEETRRVESELAARRAFEEDESRRNAPLPNENVTRVMEAMRGVSVSGFAPDWAHEDRWLDDLHHLRHSSRSPA